MMSKSSRSLTGLSLFNKKMNTTYIYPHMCTHFANSLSGFCFWLFSICIIYLEKYVSYYELCASCQKVCEDTISFRHLLSTFPAECQAAAPEDISPHLCFICLLHLANEHGFSIHDCPTLDDLRICLPSSF